MQLYTEQQTKKDYTPAELKAWAEIKRILCK